MIDFRVNGIVRTLFGLFGYIYWFLFALLTIYGCAPNANCVRSTCRYLTFCLKCVYQKHKFLGTCLPQTGTLLTKYILDICACNVVPSLPKQWRN